MENNDPVPMEIESENTDITMTEVETSNNSAGNVLNVEEKLNQVPVVKQPQAIGGSVSQPLNPREMDDQQSQFNLLDTHPGHQAGSSDPPVGTPYLSAGQNQQPENADSQLVDQQAVQIPVTDNQTPGNATVQSAQDRPTQDVTGATNTIGMQPSAPLDTAKLKIRVEWTEPFPEEKNKKKILQKALQSWFNSELAKGGEENYSVLDIQPTSENHAEVEVAPSSALHVLKDIKTASLKSKDTRNSIVVHFLVDDTKPVLLNSEIPVEKNKVPMPEVDMFVTAVVDLDKWPKDVQNKLRIKFGNPQTENKLSFSGSLVKVEKFYREVCKIVGGSEAGMDTGAVRNDPNIENFQKTRTSEAPPALAAPLHQYWYFSHACKKDISQIQEKFGVKIDAEVSVSVTAKDQTRSDCLRKASDKLTDLYQTSTTCLQSLLIPQTQLDSEIIKDVVRNIQSDRAKMAIMMSADGCILSGPTNTISGVQSRLNSEFGQEFGRSVGSNVPGKMEIDRSSTSISSTMEMDIKDTGVPIVMSDVLWKLMNKTSRKQFAEIENKYGVNISNLPAQDSTTKVMIKSKDDQRVNLESHAYRAFIHLYQKISMSAISCLLTSPLEEKNVKNEIEGHRLVGVKECYKIRRLVGLPRNLAPAIADIEKLVGKSVCDDKTKKLIDYSENSQKFSSFSWTNPEGASSSAMGPGTSVDPENFAKKESDENKNDNCPICMDEFTDQKKLTCGHGFCRECLKRSEKSLGEICPVCKKIYGTLRGNQPQGTMTHTTIKCDLPGYRGCDAIVINYDIPGGKQTDDHSNPGTYFSGTHRRAYLPDNAEGNEVLKLLKRAFAQKLIFTVGTSSTSGVQNTVTWNDIHHKTNMTGGPQNYGYPDPDYLKRVKEELKAKGIE